MEDIGVKYDIGNLNDLNKPQWDGVYFYIVDNEKANNILKEKV